MIEIHPKKLYGSWTEGYVLDFHSVSSTFLGEDEFGHPRFETKRSDMGELVYKMKYKNDQQAIAMILDTIHPRLQKWILDKHISAIIPVPFSKKREIQPLYVLAQGFAQKLGLPCKDDLIAKKSAGEAKAQDKNIVMQATKNSLKLDNILLMDDVFESGATLEECTRVLKSAYNAQNIYVLCLTIKRKIFIRV